MTDPNIRTPAPEGVADEPNTRPASGEGAAPHDAIGNNSDEISGGETTRADPDALDQSVGRGGAEQGDARTQDGAI